MNETTDDDAKAKQERDALIAQLKQKYRLLGSRKVGGLEIFFRGPTRDEVRQYKNKRTSEPALANDLLVQLCIVHPDKTTVAALFEDYAFAPDVIERELVALSIGSEESERKKL